MLITDDYRALLTDLHQQTRGGKSVFGGIQTKSMGPIVLDVLHKHDCKAVLDYGAGKGHIGEYLLTHGFAGDYRPYDPAINYWAATPEPCEAVCCIDVLEHIEPELLDAVLDDLQRVTLGIGVITVCCRPAKKTLADGRNAHLIVQPAEWWEDKLKSRFVIEQQSPLYDVSDGSLLGAEYIVRPLP